MKPIRSLCSSARLYLTPLVLLCSCMLSTAQQQPEQNQTREAGAYSRKSISALNALWLLDPSVQSMPQHYSSIIIERVREQLQQQRFDFNPIPPALLSDFVEQANAVQLPDEQKAALDSITAVLQRTLVPQIIQAVSQQASLRAQGLLSEQQRNSFITDKAKESGISATELEAVMNAAYVLVPVARGFGIVKTETMHTASMDIGFVLWRINHSDTLVTAQPILQSFSRCVGQGKIGESFITSRGSVNHEEFALESMAKCAARNLGVKLQTLPEFRLSSQVLEKNFFALTFPAPATNGVRVDDTYRIIEVDDSRGTEQRTAVGWVQVIRLNPKQERARARIVSGSPALGYQLEEYPRLPLDISLAATTFSLTTSKDATLELSPGFGGELRASYAIGKTMRVPQLFAGLAFGIGTAPTNTKGTLSFEDSVRTIDNTMLLQGEFFLTKKWFVRRVGLILQPSFGLQYLFANADSNATTTESVRFSNNGGGFGLGGGVEFALSPAVSLGALASLNLYAKNNTWEVQSRQGGEKEWKDEPKLRGNAVDHQGMRMQLFLKISPPSLAVDPLDMVRARAGI